jgi:hypothetical protein
MRGVDLLNEPSKRIAKRHGKQTISDVVLAKEIGVTPPNLALWRSKTLTVRQVANLLEKGGEAGGVVNDRKCDQPYYRIPFH